VPVGIGNHGIEGQRLRPPKTRIVSPLEPTHLDVVLEAAALVVDRETMGLKTFYPVNEPCRLLICVTEKKFNQDAGASVARCRGQKCWRDRDTHAAPELIRDYLGPDLQDAAPIRFLKQVTVAPDQKRVGRRGWANKNSLGLVSNGTNWEFIVRFPSI
jgi:hypothetical protein